MTPIFYYPIKVYQGDDLYLVFCNLPKEVVLTEIYEPISGRSI